jgi:hypothetical protein
MKSDAYAVDYLDNWSEPFKIVSFIPASKSSLSIAGITTTSNVARRLHQAASSPALEKHIVSKNNYDEWSFEASSNLECTQEQQFVIKWVRNLLPTRRHMKGRFSLVNNGLNFRWSFLIRPANCLPNPLANRTFKPSSR